LLGIIYKDLHQNSANQLNFSWDKLWDAYQRGQNSQFDVDSWQPELLWELPVTEVQALFCI
nr:hypothetical protein [Aphanothece sp. CMT-3BRIN-NPC111]